MESTTPATAGRASIVYHLYAPGRLVYVGVTDDLDRRLAEHRRSSWWWPCINPLLTYVEAHPTREAAEEAERVAIQTLHPAANVTDRLPVIRRDW